MRVLLLLLTAAVWISPAGAQVLIDESFGKDQQGLGNWWVEGGRKVWVEDGRLHVDADAIPPDEPGWVATVWHRKPVSGNVRVEFEAHCVSSSIGANNINFFLFYSHPEPGKTLYSTRQERSDAGYSKYHGLNGYIFTFLRDYAFEDGKTPNGGAKARFRMRRCPGFNLLAQDYDDSGCEMGVTYHVEITRIDGMLKFFVDGKLYLEQLDEAPLDKGLIGLRTFRTHLWWDNIRVTQLPE